MKKQRIVYTPQGVCSKQMTVEVEDGVISEIQVVGGCHGNLQGLCALLRGMDAAEAVRRLEGIDCRGKGTSCPDQLSKALRQLLSTGAGAYAKD